MTFPRHPVSRNRFIAVLALALFLLPATLLHAQEEFYGPFNAWVDVQEEFGAVGDGEADDTAALQAAFDSLQKFVNGQRPSGPRTLYLPAGTYRITGTLELLRVSGISIIGEHPETTRLLWDGPEGERMLWFNGKDNRFSRLTFDGQGTALAGLSIRWNNKDDGTQMPSSGLEVSDMIFQDLDYGIEAGGTLGWLDSEALVLRSRFLRCSEYGIGLRHFNAANYWVRHCYFEECGSGVSNVPEPYGGTFNVHDSVFVRSTRSDMSIGHAGFFGAHGNLSVGSERFFNASFSGQNGAKIVCRDNIILDPESTPFVFGTMGNVLLADNTARLLPEAENFVYVEVGSYAPATYFGWNNIYTPTTGEPYKSTTSKTFIRGDQVVNRVEIADRSPQPYPFAESYLEKHGSQSKVITLSRLAEAGAMQAAIDEAAAHYADTGVPAIVFFPDALYFIDETLTVPAGVPMILHGEGPFTQLQRAVGSGLQEPVLRLLGPTKVTFRDINVRGPHPNDNSGQSIDSAIVVEDFDQEGGRVHMQLSTLEAGRAGAHFEGVDRTHAQLIAHEGGPGMYGWQESEGESPEDPKPSLKVEGGPLSRQGKATGGVYALGLNQSRLEALAGGRLVVTDSWYEHNEYPYYATFSGTSDILIDCTKIARIRTYDNEPVFRLRDFKGTFTLLNFYDGYNNSRPLLEFVGDCRGARVLIVGSDGEYRDYLPSEAEAEAAGVRLVTVNAMHWGSRPNNILPDMGEADEAFLEKMFALEKDARWLPLEDTGTGRTDLRAFRLFTIYAETGVHLRNPAQTNAAATPRIEPSAQRLTYTVEQGESLSSDVLEVRNGGSGTLNYTLSENAAWMSTSSTSGSSTGNWRSHTLNFSTASRAPGTYTGTITLASSQGGVSSVQIPVELHVIDPRAIELEETHVSQNTFRTTNAQGISFSLRSAGGEAISYTMESAAPWVQAAPASGTASGSWDTINLQFDTTNLPAGLHSGLVTIRPDSPHVAPAVLQVNLTVEEAPEGYFEPAFLQFEPMDAPEGEGKVAIFRINAGQNIAARTVTVRKYGGGREPRVWLQEYRNWMNLSTYSDTIHNNGGSLDIGLTFDTAGLAPGTYTGNISVRTPGASDNLTIIVHVSGGSASPVLALDASVLTLNATTESPQASGTVRIANAGGGSLTYSDLQEQVPWLSASPLNGTLTAASGWQEITVQADASGLEPGLYEQWIKVRNGGTEYGSFYVYFFVSENDRETFAEWVAESLTPLPDSILPPSEEGPDGDPDGDGLPNFAEYALELDPTHPDAAALEQVAQELPGAYRQLQYAFDLRKNTADAIVSLEWSLDGTNWESLQGTPNVTGETATSQSVLYTADAPDLFAPYFLRLRIDRMAESTPGSGYNTLAASYYGPVLGTYGLDLQPGRNHLSMALQPSAVLRARGSALTGSLLRIEAPAYYQPAVQVADLFEPGEQYYLEIVDTQSPYAGERFEVDETATALRLRGEIALVAGAPENTLSSLPGNLGSPRVALFRHVRVGDFLGTGQTALALGSSDINEADHVVYAEKGLLEMLYFLENEDNGVAVWENPSQNKYADYADLKILPGQGFYLLREAPVSSYLALAGTVRKTPLRQKLSHGVNLIGSGFPQERSLLQAGFGPAQGLHAGSSLSQSDRLFMWTDGTLEMNYLHSSGTWFPLSGGSSGVSGGDFVRFDRIFGLITVGPVDGFAQEVPGALAE